MAAFALRVSKEKRPRPYIMRRRLMGVFVIVIIL